MEKYISKAALVAEIERIKKEECPIDTYEGRIKLFYFERFLSFLDTLEEPANEDLEEAAYEASLNNFVDPEYLDDDELCNFDWIRYYEKVFKTGALWQKQQDSIEVKDVDLDEEFSKWWKSERAKDYNVDILYEKYSNASMKLAKYFFELGKAK